MSLLFFERFLRMLLFFIACSNSKVENDLDLSEAASMIYGYSTEDRLMVVISDLPSLCAELQSGESPKGDWWSLALWTQNRAIEPGDYAAFGYLNISESRDFSMDTALDYWRTSTPSEAEIHITNSQNEELKGSYSVRFDGDISISVTESLQASSCDGVYLFAGIKE